LSRTLGFTSAGISALLILISDSLHAAPAGIEEVIPVEQPAKMIEKEGEVRFRHVVNAEVAAAVPQDLSFGDGLRTLLLSRAAVRLTDQTSLRLSELTILEVRRREPTARTPAVRILEGKALFSSRSVEQSIPVETPHTRAVPRGTEFLVSVEPQAGRTVFTMFQGRVDLNSPATNAVVRSGQQGIVSQDGSIVIRPILEARNIVQWWLYYPGVLDPAELKLDPAEKADLGASLSAYAAGDLPAALRSYPGYPALAEPRSEAQRVYLAGLLLAVGAVDRAEEHLAKARADLPAAHALQTLIAAVQNRFSTAGAGLAGSGRAIPAALTASELLALSYGFQSTHDLPEALRYAREAVRRSPNFGFGWARVAELEFGFGRTGAAHEAVQSALRVTPRNAQAHVVLGFLLAAENRTRDALAAFETAIGIDPALGHGWLGRGLCRWRLQRIQIGPTHEGPAAAEWLSDIQTAAILEPTRALLRSYAAKAFAELGDEVRAFKELDYAKTLDPNDPTPWLYSALELQRENRINEAVPELEKSIELNENRAVFRSRLLLDEDRAVRSANLARIYADAGMTELGMHEAARAVNDQYANYSAHLFLSEALDQLRDPTRFSLRYETPWFNELLLANLLAPVGGTPLSQNISQQQYSRLFENDRLGLSTWTEVRSDGQYRELASQYGNVKDTAWSLDLDYQHNNGVRENNALDRIEWYTTVKQQITPKDSVLLLTKYQDYHSGDNFQYYDPASARPYFKFDESQSPIAVGAYHHEWAPGIHTLVLAGRLENDQRLSDRAVTNFVLIPPQGPVGAVQSSLFDVKYRSQAELWTSELNQIFQSERNTLIVGGRFQAGEIETSNWLTNVTPFSAFFPLVDQEIREDVQRWSLYAYDIWELVDNRLWFTGGLSYDDLTFPENYRQVPISPGQDTARQLSPKGALLWNITPAITLRGAYAQSLGGVTLDESFRLEPAQLAGFNQSYRTIIPESVVGSVSAPSFETAGLGLDIRCLTRTYLSVSGEVLRSDLDRVQGVYGYPTADFLAVPISTPQTLRYEERSARFVLNQLLSAEWAAGVAYQFTRSELEQNYPAIPTTVFRGAHTFDSADLHNVALQLLYNHPSGFFARAVANWYMQDSFRRVAGDPEPALPGDAFWQADFWVGYRLRRTRGEIALGILNATDTDYRLNPVNAHVEFPRERVYAAQLRLRF
jgi:Tfp pilus assembly protein PilF